MNVLLVEDDKQVGDFIASELLATGHTCIHAQDGEAGF
jgi:DNA-binding response OmpR family regulator